MAIAPTNALMFNSSHVGYNGRVEDMTRGSVAVLDRPTVGDSPNVALSIYRASQLMPLGQRREFTRWLKLLRRRTYPIENDRAMLDIDGRHLGGLSAELLQQATGIAFAACHDCGVTRFAEELTEIGDCSGESVCARCLSRSYFNCQDCDNYASTYDRVRISNLGHICEDCWNNSSSYHRCEGCGYNYHDDDGAYRDDNWYCESCTPDEPTGSGCASRNLTFTFPALCTPQRSVQNDEIIPVTIGIGEVSGDGLQSVVNAIYRESGNVLHLPEIRNMDATWQSKEGNFPKRLAKLIAGHNIKLSDSLMAECGNIAKAHVSKIATSFISLTRNLDMDPSAYENEGSCWWGEFSYSRCELKAWNGYAVRTWTSPTADQNGRPESRAWLLPVEIDEHGRVITKPTLAPNAYLLFNAYGELEMLPFARIIAGMTGKSYKKIGFEMHAYINSGAVLIAEQSICDKLNSIYLPEIADCGCS